MNIFPHRWRLSRLGVQVDVELSSAELESLRPHFVPWYDVIETATSQKETWTITAARDASQIDKDWFQCQQTQIRNEPLRKVWFAAEQKRIVVEQKDDQWKLIFCCRLIRDLLRWQISREALFVQASMVDLRGVGVAIIGHSKAGKTSLEAALLVLPGASHVAENDLTVLRATQAFLGLGWPRSLCFRQETLAEMPKLWRISPSALQHCTHPSNQQSHASAGAFTYILPRELVAICGCGLLAKQLIRLLVFPDWQTPGTPPPPPATKLSVNNVRRRLTQSCDWFAERKVGAQSPPDPLEASLMQAQVFNPFLANLYQLTDYSVQQKMIAELALTVPGYSISLSLEYLSTAADSVSQIVDVLIRAQSSMHR